MPVLHGLPRGSRCGSVAGMRPDPVAVEAAILQLVDARGPDKSICPSEAARALASEWHGLLGDVRRAAVSLAKAGRIDILRKGKPIDPASVHGVIRLRLHRPPAGER